MSWSLEAGFYVGDFLLWLAGTASSIYYCIDCLSLPLELRGFIFLRVVHYYHNIQYDIYQWLSSP